MEFMPPPSGPGPVVSDKDHPYISNQVALATGKQPTFRVSDLSNPILKPWVVAELRKVNEAVLAGKPMFNREVRCWTPGVPAFLLDPGQLFFIQTPKEVWLIGHDDHRVRRVYLNQKHSARPKLSWYGESVGHYEGDTLVVDTIGLNDKTLNRQLPNASHRSAPRRGTFQAHRWGQHARGDGDRRGPGRLQHGLVGDPAISGRASGPAARKGVRGRYAEFFQL